MAVAVSMMSGLWGLKCNIITTELLSLKLKSRLDEGEYPETLLSLWERKKTHVLQIIWTET